MRVCPFFYCFVCFHFLYDSLSLLPVRSTYICLSIYLPFPFCFSFSIYLSHFPFRFNNLSIHLSYSPFPSPPFPFSLPLTTPPLTFAREALPSRCSTGRVASFDPRHVIASWNRTGRGWLRMKVKMDGRSSRSHVTFTHNV